MRCGPVVVLAVCAIMLLRCTTTPSAAAEVLAKVPASALGVVVVNRPAATLAKVRQLAAQLQVPIPELPGLFGIWLAAAEGPEAGSCLALAVLPLEKDAAIRPLLYVAVKEPTRFLGQFQSVHTDAGISTVEHRGVKFLVRQVDQYAVLAQPEHRAALEQIGKGPSFADELPDWQPWVVKNDVSLVITRAGIVQAAVLGGRARAEMTAIATMFPVPAIGLAARATPASDIELTLRTVAPAKSDLATFFSRLPAMNEDLLKLLPAAPMEGAVALTVPTNLAADATATMSRRMVSRLDASKIAPEQLEKLDTLSEQVFKDVRSASLLLQTARQGDANFFINVLAAYRTDNAGAVLDAYERLFGQLSAIEKLAGNKSISTSAKRTEFEGLKALEVSIDLAPLEQQLSMPRSKLIADFFGPEGEPSMWLVALDDHTVLSGQFRRDLLRRAIAMRGGKEPGLVADPRVAAMAKKLPDGASLIGYWNPAATAFSLKQRGVVPETLPTPSDPATAPLVGIAAKITGADFQLIAVVPEGVWRMLGDLKAAGQPRGAAEPKPAVPSQPKASVSPRPATATRAVAAGLNWLARHQATDGRWSPREYRLRCRDKTCTGPGDVRAEVHTTAIALLAFLAADQTHIKKGPYRLTVHNAIGWLMRQQKADGDLSAVDPEPVVAHAMATWALCEAYGLSKDATIQRAAEKAVEYLHRSLSKDSGTVGWQLAALKSAAAVGLQPDAEKFHSAVKQIAADLIPPAEAALAAEKRNPARMTVLLLTRQYLGAPEGDAQSAEAVRCLMAHLPETGQQDLRYRLFASLAMQNAPVADRKIWNSRLAKALVAEQSRELPACSNGSWPPDAIHSDAWGTQVGRITATALQTLSLEAYFRYLSVVGKSTGSKSQ